MKLFTIVLITHSLVAVKPMVRAISKTETIQTVKPLSADVRLAFLRSA